MVASKVNIQTIGRGLQAPITLILKQYADGWSYEVQDLSSGPLPMPWRAESGEAAETRLRESYDQAVWTITILEEVSPSFTGTP